MRFTKKIRDLVEAKTNCGFNYFNSEGFSIYVDNDCDEDYQIEMDRNNNEVEYVIDYCEGFDADEHFKLWFGANNGEPQSARVLLNNCEQIGDNLAKLAETLREVL